jgi:ArsR family transcriptional regulator
MPKKFERLGASTINCLADVLRLLGEPNRLRILCTIGNDCKSVTELMSETGIEQSNASFHLRFLRNAALVNAESRGRNMYYRVQDKELLRLIGELAHWMNKALPNNVKSDAEIRSKSLRKRKGTPV